MRQIRWRSVACLGAWIGLAACAQIDGYPADPATDRSLPQALRDALDQTAVDKYSALEDKERRAKERDRIVFARMDAYEVEFQSFKRRLWGDSNLVGAGGDLTLLTLGGLGATTGHVATASALAAASIGIVGAQTAISKDVYYQRTMPALLAQIEANRDKVKTKILTGLAKPDDQYPLGMAILDLHALQGASGIPDAVAEVTQQARADLQDAKDDVAAVAAMYKATDRPKELVDRVKAFAAYIRNLYSSKADDDGIKLDRIMSVLKTSKGSSRLFEAANIIAFVDLKTKEPGGGSAMDGISASLFDITQQRF
jgi:hypothetical protein